MSFSAVKNPPGRTASPFFGSNFSPIAILKMPDSTVSCHCLQYDRDLELALIDSNGVHAIRFPCRRVLGRWIKAEMKNTY
jgi:hypothetical protein